MLHPCPKCSKKGFTWSIDEEESPLTQWRCWKCGYIEWEDEKRNRRLPEQDVKRIRRLSTGAIGVYIKDGYQDEMDPDYVSDIVYWLDGSETHFFLGEWLDDYVLLAH